MQLKPEATDSNWARIVTYVAQHWIDDLAIYLEYNPNAAKAYDVRAAARVAIKDIKGAIADYQQAAALYQQEGDMERYQYVMERLKELQR